MATTKNERIYIRVAEDVKQDFEILAQFKGLKTATFLHSLIVKTIHEARAENPLIFPASKKEESKNKADVNTEQVKKISVKSKKNKSNQSAKTFTTRDGKTISLVDEAQAFDEEQ